MAYTRPAAVGMVGLAILAVVNLVAVRTGDDGAEGTFMVGTFVFLAALRGL